jgi:ATP-dependent DNA ligase
MGADDTGVPTSIPPAGQTSRVARSESEFRGLRFSDHIIGDGPAFRQHACRLTVEGAVSKRIGRPYAPGDRGIWVKSKCLNREEFFVVGWTDPTGSRPHIGSLLLGYYTDDGTRSLGIA